MKKMQIEAETQINAYKPNVEKLNEKIKQLQNEVETKAKLIDEVNTIILKNNAYFEQTNIELVSNKQKIEELNELYINVKKELHSKEVELEDVNQELILCQNDYVIRQSQPKR